jgi:hypothetical protein
MTNVKRIATCMAILCAAAFGQNYAVPSASNIEDLNGNKLTAGTICFAGTDATDTPINFQVGGGGQILKRPFCFNIAAGAITTAIGGGTVQIPNPANTTPVNIRYRIQVRDSLSNQLVIDYRNVAFTGTTFNFDTYVPNTPGMPLGSSVSGDFTVGGVALLNASSTITAAPTPATNNIGWKRCMFSNLYCDGVAGSTWAVTTGGYFSIFDGAAPSYPANDAGSAPDSHAKVSLKNDGSAWLKALGSGGVRLNSSSDGVLAVKNYAGTSGEIDLATLVVSGTGSINNLSGVNQLGGKNVVTLSSISAATNRSGLGNSASFQNVCLGAAGVCDNASVHHVSVMIDPTPSAGTMGSCSAQVRYTDRRGNTITDTGSAVNIGTGGTPLVSISEDVWPGFSTAIQVGSTCSGITGFPGYALNIEIGGF